LAARTTADNSLTTPQRISFAKINEVLEVPKLLSLQTDSFNWLIGNDAWLEQVAAREANGEDVSHKSGLTEIFEEISPIEDFSETMSLSFENPVFYDPKYTVTTRRTCAEVLDLRPCRVHTRGDVRPAGQTPFVVRGILRYDLSLRLLSNADRLPGG